MLNVLVPVVASIPLNKVDDPREQDGSSFVYLKQILRCQLLLEVVKDLNNFPDLASLDFRSIEKDKLYLKGHRGEDFSGQDPTGGDAAL